MGLLPLYWIIHSLSRLEDELFLSLKRAKTHFERNNIALYRKGLI